MANLSIFRNVAFSSQKHPLYYLFCNRFFFKLFEGIIHEVFDISCLLTYFEKISFGAGSYLKLVSLGRLIICDYMPVSNYVTDFRQNKL